MGPAISITSAHRSQPHVANLGVRVEPRGAPLIPPLTSPPLAPRYSSMGQPARDFTCFVVAGRNLPLVDTARGPGPANAYCALSLLNPGDAVPEEGLVTENPRGTPTSAVTSSTNPVIFNSEVVMRKRESPPRISRRAQGVTPVSFEWLLGAEEERLRSSLAVPRCADAHAPFGTQRPGKKFTPLHTSVISPPPGCRNPLTSNESVHKHGPPCCILECKSRRA